MYENLDKQRSSINLSDELKVQNPSLIGIITNPSQQFDRIYEKPLIGFAMVITMVFYAVGYLLEVTDETTSIIGSIIGVIIGVILRVFILSAVFMFFTTFAPKSTVTLKQLGSMNTYISFILAINVLVSGIAIFMIGGNPTVLFTNMETIINLIFTIWIIVLTALGLERVAGFSKKLAWFAAILVILVTFFDQVVALFLILVLYSLLKFGLLLAKQKDN
ncbi:hypothetical protein EU245_11080 [Lentibacillus lipolyticus]|nr:hypothetical protein EU245_11080 [Lentibacillus lipolyticus]